jgi:hypothetical protein
MDVRWTSRHRFAEVAEALGVRTDQVMATGPRGVVLFTLEDVDDPMVCSALLLRRSDGALEATHRRRLMRYSTWARKHGLA